MDVAVSTFSALPGELNLVIKCPDCGQNINYSWTYDTSIYEALRDGITSQHQNLTFDKVEDADFTKYLCTAQSSNQKMLFKMELVKKGRQYIHFIRLSIFSSYILNRLC